jgi:heat-inducible transcriptional repressor
MHSESAKIQKKRELIQPNNTLLSELNDRAREIFRGIVETYLATGEPVGSRTLSLQGIGLSPATIRNTMSDLANMGLLDAAHISAGRAPTDLGIRLFVDGLLEISEIDEAQKNEIDARMGSVGDDISSALSEASNIVSSIAGAAGLVTTPNRDAAIRQIEFVALGQGKILIILVSEDGHIENRFIDVPYRISASQLQESSNFMNHHLKGRTLSEALKETLSQKINAEKELDEAAQRLIKDGIAQWAGIKENEKRKLIVRGRANLLNNTDLNMDIEKVRILFDELEKKQALIEMLDAAKDGYAIKLFIGAESPLFALSGSALIAAPYLDNRNRVIGALGVIGPTNINYARVIPIVDYTAQMLTKMISNRGFIT